MSSNWAASALDWWEEAGVDMIVGEQPRDWLNPGTKDAVRPLAPAPAALPDSLDAFQAWLAASEELPFADPSVARAMPSGDPGADLMVMVDMPSDDGDLLSGEAGALFDKMLVAIGRTRESIYLASLSPIRTPTGAIDERSAARLAEIARHHAGLVGPRVLLLFGDICGKALVGSAVAGARAKWHEIATPAGAIKALVTIKPEKLVETPAWKKFAWADLQMLMEALT
ncbi:MAG: uracil-DNA glycosylase [Sphingomonadales bacterium]|jgi:DNA polymerase|nr:uracil-DNA glycosylase [Sphingomonadales bacterium]